VAAFSEKIDHTARENIMTGFHFLGCKCCGTYDRHDQVAQVAIAYFKYELKFTSSTSSVDSNYVGTSADGKSKHTDGQVCQWEEHWHLLAAKTGL
jgi:hypothetical protein